MVIQYGILGAQEKTMALWNRTEKSILSLVHQLTEEAKTALKQELELGKAEISEHVAKYGRHAGIIAGGALLAYGGLIVLLICLGILISWGLMRAGLDAMVAIFAGLGLVAILAIAVGMTLVLFFIKKLKALSAVPTRTMNEAKALTAIVTGKEPRLSGVTRPEEIKQSSAEAEVDVRRTRHDLSDTVQELKERLTFRSLGKAATQHVKAHPVQLALAGVGVGFVTYLIIRQKSRGRAEKLVQTPSAKIGGIFGKLGGVLRGIELLRYAHAAFASNKPHPTDGSLAAAHPTKDTKITARGPR
jgi:hypothetical protein